MQKIHLSKKLLRRQRRQTNMQARFLISDNQGKRKQGKICADLSVTIAPQLSVRLSINAAATHRTSVNASCKYEYCKKKKYSIVFKFC